MLRAAGCGRCVAALVLVLLATGQVAVAVASEPTPGIVRYERDRLTVQVAAMPLATLLERLAAVSHATLRGDVPVRSVTVDLAGVPLSEGLTTILGAHSFMLTYGGDGALRTIELLATAPASSPFPSGSPSPSPRPPLADEEAQATILQRPITVDSVLAQALDTDHPPIGRVLHAALLEPRAAVRAAAREAALDTFTRDPEIAAAYLSTLAPVDDATLAKILRGSAVDGSAEEWMAALAARAPTAALRQKATAILTVMQHWRP